MLGWSTAILMQLAHPLVAAGVLQHSSFRGNAFQAAVRLHHTVRAMLALTFGDAASRTAAVERIKAIHRRVNGTLPAPVGNFPAGTTYSAEYPELLLWVHATVVVSTIKVYQAVVEPLRAADLDRLCEESVPTLVELGGDASSAPRTWRALCDYIETVESAGVLAVTDESRALGEAVLAPRAAGIAVPFSRLHRLVSIGFLPASIREAYGFPWDARRQRRFTRAISWLQATRRVTPAFIARWPEAR